MSDLRSIRPRGDYRIVIPHSIPNPAPILFAFHGMGESTESMADYSHLDRLAARNGFILVYPAALRSMWATMEIDPDDFEANPDVRFFDRLLEYLSSCHEIDPDRVYVAGMSNGASFVHLLATARSTKIAAVVAHYGSKPRDLGPSDNPRPIMLVVGQDDSACSVLRSEADRLRSAGHVVDFVSVPGLAHEWSVRHNAEMWDFLSQFSRTDRGITA